jgi:hypothetical protein
MGMKKLVILLISLSFIWGVAKDDALKVKGEIISVKVEARTLQIADTGFWVDTRTKIEDNYSNPLAFSDLESGNSVELEYTSQTNDAGFHYTTKIEVQD